MLYADTIKPEKIGHSDALRVPVVRADLVLLLP